MSINRALIVGNLTRDVELRSTKSGTAVAELGVAVNERIKRGDSWEDYASYFDVTVWGKTAEACNQYLAKGSKVAVDGRIRQDRWKNDAGENRSKVKVIANTVQFLGGKDSNSDDGPSDAGPPDSSAAPLDDDIPL